MRTLSQAPSGDEAVVVAVKVHSYGGERDSGSARVQAHGLSHLEQSDVIRESRTT